MNDFIGVLEWAAHHRYARVMKALAMQMEEAGVEHTDERVLERVYLAGLDDAASEADTPESYELILDTINAQREWFLRSMTNRELFDMLAKVMRQMILSVVRVQLPACEDDITDEDVAGLDLTKYFHLLDTHFPSNIRTQRLPQEKGKGKKRKQGEEDPDPELLQELEYEVLTVEKNRKMLLDVYRDRAANRNKVLYLLQQCTHEAFLSEVRGFTKKAEEKLLPPPLRLLLAPPEAEPEEAIRQANIRREWSRSALSVSDEAFQNRARDHLNGLRESGPSPEAVKPSAKGKERQLLAERTSKLKQSLKDKGGDPLRSKSMGGAGAKMGRKKEEDDMPPMEQTQEPEPESSSESSEESEGKEVEVKRPRTRNTARAEAASPPAKLNAVKPEPRSAGKWSGRLRMDDPRRPGKEVAFQDSQYKGDATESESSSEAKGRGKGKGKVAAKGKGKDDEEAMELDRDSIESEESSDESLNPPKRLGTPGRPKRFSLGKHAAPAKSGKRVFWTNEEVALLRKAVLEDGHRGDWAYIRDHYRLNPCRTAVDIKDKWRNLEKGP